MATAAIGSEAEDEASPRRRFSLLSQTEVMSETSDATAGNSAFLSRREGTMTAGSGGTALEKPKEDRMSSFRTRVVWGFALLCGFALIISAGHVYGAILVVFLSSGMYKEVIALKRNVEKDKLLPMFYILRWFFYCITVFFLVRRALGDQLSRLAVRHKAVAWVLHYHSMITYCLLCVGLILFVLSLRRYTLKYQFTQLAWTLVTLILVVTQSVGHIANIYQGLVWFLLPTTLVVCNDIFAYFFGFFFGRTRLIKLSPKKTWEGFIGGSICTLIWAVLMADVMQRFAFFVCPVDEITFTPFQSITKCDAHNELFEKSVHVFRGLWVSQLQVHALILGIFASLVAPFGGFFASGFKRAFKIKDFADTIPGHGGITDRFDCQVIMGMFTYIYILTFVQDGTNGESGDHAVNTLYSMILALPIPDRAKLIHKFVGNTLGAGLSTGNVDLLSRDEL